MKKITVLFKYLFVCLVFFYLNFALIYIYIYIFFFLFIYLFIFFLCSRCPAISNYIYNILHVAWCEVYIIIHVNNINIILDTIKIWFVNLLTFVLKCCLKMNGTVHSKYNTFLSFKFGLLILCGLVDIHFSWRP